MNQSEEETLGKIVKNNEFSLDDQQKSSWITQIQLLHKFLTNLQGSILFELFLEWVGVWIA